MRRILSASIAVVALLMLALSTATAQAATRQIVVMKFENIGFAEPTQACPVFIITFDIVSPDGSPLGTGSSCIQSFVGCDPFFVGCRQRAETIFTFALSGRDPIVVAATVNEIVLDDDPFTLAHFTRGTVVNGTGQLIGAGTIVFTAEGIQSNLVYVLILTE
jgi:hypothetical protein